MIARRLRHAFSACSAALRAWWLVRRHRARLGGKVRFRGGSPLVANQGHLVIGAMTEFDCRTYPIRLTVLPGATLEIGRGTFLNRGTAIAAAGSVRLGDHCLVGEWVSILDTDFHPVHADTPVRIAPVSIGRNVWLANRVTVLPGVTIGDHAVVGAGAVVAHDLPARAIAVGNPARVVGSVRGPDDFRRSHTPPPRS